MPQPNRHPRARRDQRHALERWPQANQVLIRDGVHDGNACAFGLELVDALLHRSYATCQHSIVNQTDLALGLCLQHADQVGVLHGGERVVLHAAFIEQRVARKQVTLEDAALVVRKSRRGDGEGCAQRVHQGLGNRPYIALRRAVKGGAVFEVDLLRALRLQPGQRGQ